MVTLKTATTLDGRIAARTGASRWITGETARAAAHKLRAQHDGVLIGPGTLAADDPALTVRLPGLPLRPPVRIVLKGRGALPAKAKILTRPGRGPVWVVGAGRAPATRRGVEWVMAEGRPGTRPTPKAVLDALARRGLTRLLIEGGADIAAAFVRAGLVDRLVWFRAPTLLGGDAVGALAALGIAEPAAAKRWRLLDARSVGADAMETYVALR